MLSEFDNRGQDAIAESLRAINDARFDGCRHLRIVVHDSSRDSNDFCDFCFSYFLSEHVFNECNIGKKIFLSSIFLLSR